VTPPCGPSGWVPIPVLSGDRILRDYDATELTVTAGAQVTCFEAHGGWRLCRLPSGKTGWIPESCLSV